MKLFKKMKDGGPDSSVTGYWLIEWKSVFSIVLLNFRGKGREEYHSHAFNAISWVLKGELREEPLHGSVNYFFPSLRPIYTPRSMVHRVDPINDERDPNVPSTWVLSFRGPWSKTWFEYWPKEDVYVKLGPGRQIIETKPNYIEDQPGWIERDD